MNDSDDDSDEANYTDEAKNFAGYGFFIARELMYAIDNEVILKAILETLQFLRE
jgi:hypothetical protein